MPPVAAAGLAPAAARSCSKKTTCMTTRSGRRLFCAAWMHASLDSFFTSIKLEIFRSSSPLSASSDATDNKYTLRKTSMSVYSPSWVALAASRKEVGEEDGDARGGVEEGAEEVAEVRERAADDDEDAGAARCTVHHGLLLLHHARRSERKTATPAGE
uniref:Uncharacterized protein n=1 Tax=Oryza meridionalis TaxID=40149 RepID=A0A0E0ENW8_9ORYZ